MESKSKMNLVYNRNRAVVESVIDIPGVRIPFEPFFMLMDLLGRGGIRFIVARKPYSGVYPGSVS